MGYCRGVLIAGVRSIQTFPYGSSMVFGGRDVVCALCCFPELSENVNGRGSLDGNAHIPSAVCVAFLFSRHVLWGFVASELVAPADRLDFGYPAGGDISWHSWIFAASQRCLEAPSHAYVCCADLALTRKIPSGSLPKSCAQSTCARGRLTTVRGFSLLYGRRERHTFPGKTQGPSVD